MATYNGEAYIKAQIESIISQTYSDWELIIRDDGSTDQTLAIINNYLNADQRISVLNDTKGNVRSCQNFSILMSEVVQKAQYVMFCDQDDIWLSTKIEVTLKNMLEIDDNKPAMVFGTHTLIDENNVVLNKETRNYNFGIRLELLLASSFVYGCTMMINKNLLRKCINIPISAENHDYWIALIAATCNANTKYISEPLILYRQHNNNVSGNFENSSTVNRFSRLIQNMEIKAIRHKAMMFKDLLMKSDKWITEKDSLLIQNYITVVPEGGFKALYFVLKHRIKKITILSTLNYYISILRA